MALSGDITRNDIVAEFISVMEAATNIGISWAANNEPFSEVPAATWTSGGTTAGRSSALTGSALSALDIDAANIVSVLLAEAANYTSIRYMRATKVVNGDGGNDGSQPSPGLIYDSTAVGYMNGTTYKTEMFAGGFPDVAQGEDIIDNTGGVGLQIFFNRLVDEYNAISRDSNNAIGIVASICHASCHSSCHQSRGRR